MAAAPSSSMKNVMEEKFLDARRKRDEEQAKRAGAVDEFVAEQERDAFVRDVAELEVAIDVALTDETQPAKDRAEKARLLYERMKVTVENGSELLGLPTHELRRANTSMQQCLQHINDFRAAHVTAAATKKFGFSSRGKTATTSASPAPAATTTTIDRPAPSATTSSSGAPAAVVADAQDTTLSAEHESSFTQLNNGTFGIPAGLRAAFARKCKGATLHFAPVNGSVFVTECEDCTIYVACHQLRMKLCTNCHVYVWCLSTPIIEQCTGMQFASLTAWRGLLAATEGRSAESLVTYVKERAGMDRSLAHFEASHTHVDDFLWLRQQQSPNWSLLPSSDVRISDFAPPETSAPLA